MGKIFMTGSSGLIGQALRRRLESDGQLVVGCDLRAENENERFDFRESQKLWTALSDCDGVVHLAAVSRVIWGEQYPALCESINIGGIKNLTAAILESPNRPWLIFASSREIYGTPSKLPCTSDSPPNPENLYAQTKVIGEETVRRFRDNGGQAAIVRFSNVFGAATDYGDRVAPAFARAAASGGVLFVRGAESIFDFTPLGDAVCAVVRVVRAMENGVYDLPPLDIATGRATSLMEFAKMTLAFGEGDIVVEKKLPFYPARFCGDPRPAKKYLDWRPRQSLEETTAKLVGEYRRLNNDAPLENHLWPSELL